MADCAAASGKNFFVYVPDSRPGDPVGPVAYVDPTAAVFSSTLRISNVLSDVDGTTTFAPSYDATLARDPSQVYSGVYLTYSGGHVYRPGRGHGRRVRPPRRRDRRARHQDGRRGDGPRDRYLDEFSRRGRRPSRSRSSCRRTRST
jgi:hypothetical protein